jgi:hypothetical protein
MAVRVIAGRYRLLDQVGRGGTATVYRAVDGKHDREVALKVLRSDIAAAVGSARFLREIRITAGLNHPHILPLLDSGDDEGLLYYVMPYVAGGSLRLLLSRGIPLEAVIRIIREVASALDHAHARGVIHRDVKPENILFNDGLAVVSDFGIARAMSGAADTRMTGTALTIGTLGYMSPEQALGAEGLDARTDVYSLASVAYEMLVGARPTSWPGAGDVELGRLSDLPDDHRARLASYPGRVEQVLARGLALRPQHRHGTPGELAGALSKAAERTGGFTDEQVRRLLARAAELQAEASDPDPGALTIGAVEQIAAQVGIPPVHVRNAAEEMERAETGASASTASSAGRGSRPRSAVGSYRQRLAGKRWDRLMATAAVGGEVPESAFPVMVAEIQRRLGIPGHSSTAAGTLIWSPAAQGDSDRKLVVHVAAEHGVTEIRIQEDLEIQGALRMAPPAGGFAGAVLGAGLGQAMALADPAVGLTILACAAGGLLVAGRAVVGSTAAARGPELEELAELLADVGRKALRSQQPLEPDPES